jgi:DNA-binding GntR family transcriptional regulator
MTLLDTLAHYLMAYLVRTWSITVKIDERLPRHSYQQLADQLRNQIFTGKITSRLPSLTELTELTGLAVGTVRRAIDVLASEEIVRTVPGRGTFVNYASAAHAGKKRRETD